MCVCVFNLSLKEWSFGKLVDFERDPGTRSILTEDTIELITGD